MSSNMKLNFYKTNWYRVSWRDGWQPEGLVLCSIVTRIRDNRHNFLNNETWEKYWGEKSGIYWSWLSWKVLSQIFERGFWKCDSILIWGLFKSWVALWTKEVKNLVMGKFPIRADFQYSPFCNKVKMVSDASPSLRKFYINAQPLGVVLNSPKSPTPSGKFQFVKAFGTFPLNFFSNRQENFLPNYSSFIFNFLI